MGLLVTAHAGTIGDVDLSELTALHDWMRANGVTECAVGGVHLKLAPMPAKPLTLTSEPPLTPEQEVEAEVRDILWSSGSDADAILEMQRRTDERIAKKRSAA